jgi:hypothetical protein
MQLIRLPDHNVSVYRFFPLRFLEEALSRRELVLVSRTRWEDPFETIHDAIAVNFHRGGQEIINQSLPPVYAQCWSTTSESDALLRAYSRVIKDEHSGRNACPRDEGVCVRSTPGKLRDEIQSRTPPGCSGSWFCGAVNYLDENEIKQEIANTLYRFGLQAYEDICKRAEFLLLKRKAFTHESEVRLLFIEDRNKPQDELIRVPIDPEKVFDEISFDPRLLPFERIEREKTFRNIGYRGPFGDSTLYQRALLGVFMPPDFMPR